MVCVLNASLPPSLPPSLPQCTYFNGSPQNTFVPGVVELAEREKVFLGGDDFKSGQMKIKSVLVEFLVLAGLKVREGGREGEREGRGKGGREGGGEGRVN